ncbi:FAD-dependent oxidoreductase [Streptomyces sp. NPDC060028]|uniref:FAD-dependent oxidoreductase n=1 Tax=Streptomyces sp. NPDC060028 TaxID=3347041 RepID=UPI0036776AA5
MEDAYDVVVIGGGPGGEVAADRVVRSGLTAVVVEAEMVGGECSYRACVPSKALLRPGAAREAARSVDGARQAVTAALDPAQVLARRDRFTGRGDDTGQAGWLNGAGIPLARGHGRLAGERRVEVTRADGAVHTLRARLAVVLSPGTEPALPPVEGLDRIGVWTNRQATTADAVPERLVVIGGGVVACEMATAWRSLGSSVTLLVRDQALLTGWEPCAGEEVTRGLTGLGVTIRFGVSATRAARDETTRTVTVETDDGATLVCDEVLAATGRSPRGVEQEPGQVGELWLRGPNIAAGYWRRPGRSAESFECTLKTADGSQDGWMRTGDHGFLHEEEVFVLGRLKDVVIIHGANHAPSDIEDTVRRAIGEAVPGGVAAFAVPGTDAEGDRLIVMVELAAGPGVAEDIGLRRRVQTAVAERHGVRPHDVVAARRGTLPRTTSGKLRRGDCRQHYLSTVNATDATPRNEVT